MSAQTDSLKSILYALAFVGMSMVAGNPVWDALGSIAVDMLLIIVVVLIGTELKVLLFSQLATKSCEATTTSQ